MTSLGIQDLAEFCPLGMNSSSSFHGFFAMRHGGKHNPSHQKRRTKRYPVPIIPTRLPVIPKVRISVERPRKTHTSGLAISAFRVAKNLLNTYSQGMTDWRMAFLEDRWVAKMVVTATIVSKLDDSPYLGSLSSNLPGLTIVITQLITTIFCHQVRDMSDPRKFQQDLANPSGESV